MLGFYGPSSFLGCWISFDYHLLGECPLVPPSASWRQWARIRSLLLDSVGHFLSTNRCEYDELHRIGKTLMNMKTLLNYSMGMYQVLSKYNWKVMADIGININRLVVSFITASGIELNPTAIRDGLTSIRITGIGCQNMWLQVCPLPLSHMWSWGIMSHLWIPVLSFVKVPVCLGLLEMIRSLFGLCIMMIGDYMTGI